MTLANKTRLACFLLAFTVVLLPGCGGKSDETGSTPVATKNTPASKDSAEAPPTSASGGSGASSPAPGNPSLANPVAPAGSGK